MAMAERKEPIRPAEPAASVVEDFTAAAEVTAAAITNRDLVIFWLIVNLKNGEKRYAANEAEFRQTSLGQSF
jgi:hypothetical protein